MVARRERPQSAAGDYAMTLEETAALLAGRRIAVSVWTLKRRIAARALPALKVGSRLWVMRADLEDWLERGGELRPALGETEPEPASAEPASATG